MNRWGSALVSLVVLIGCVLPDVACAQACATDGECAAPLLCREGSCQTPESPPTSTEPASTGQSEPQAAEESTRAARATVPPAEPAAMARKPELTRRAPVVAPTVVYRRPNLGPAPQEPSASFEQGYLSVAMLWGLGGSGDYKLGVDKSTSEDDSGKYELELMHGFNLAGYFVVNRAVHVGAFVHKLDGRTRLRSSDFGSARLADSTNVNFGFAMKAGLLIRRVFISLAADLGPALAFHRDTPTKPGLWFYPRLQFDVMVVRHTPFKASVYLAFGPAFLMARGRQDLGAGDPEVKIFYWAITPTFQLGGSFGG